jgi:cytochrome c biogenesis protein ResB
VKLLEFIGSAKLAITLVSVLILLSIAGAMLPQEGPVQPADLDAWRTAHPFWSFIGSHLGLFQVFHSPLFLAVILLTGINTLTCTILHLLKRKNNAGSNATIKTTGFAILHLSLIVLFAGGFVSTAFSLDGYIVLTEGQHFIETPEHYLRLNRGPLRKAKHKRFKVRLERCSADYSPDWRLLQIHASLRPDEENQRIIEALRIDINNPAEYRGFSFTLDQTGFSPLIRFSKNNQLIGESYIALKTLQEGHFREYRDTVRAPLPGKMIITLYPAHTILADGEIKKTGEEPDNPALIVEVLDNSGNVNLRQTVKQGESIELGQHTLSFTGLRRWASFRVMEDPGYPIILIALWLGILGLGMRYVPEVAGWIKSPGNE